MYKVKVCTINAVLADFLHVRVYLPLTPIEVGPFAVATQGLFDTLWFPSWRFFVGVIPDKNLLVNFPDFPCSKN